MPEYSEIKSKFILDRVAETRWKNREYIGHLSRLARILESGGPKGFAGGMAYTAIIRDYPVEAEALRLEINEGRLVSSEELMAMKRAHQRKLRKDKEDLKRLQEKSLREEEQAYQEWLTVGGKP